MRPKTLTAGYTAIELYYNISNIYRGQNNVRGGEGLSIADKYVWNFITRHAEKKLTLQNFSNNSIL